MTDRAPGETAPNAEQTFHLPAATTSKVWPWILGGVAAFSFGAVGFLLAVFSSVGQLQAQLMTSFPVLLGIGCFLTAWSISRSPRQVQVGPAGIRMVGRHGTRDFGWHQIGWSSIQQQGLQKGRQLVLYDAEGKTIARLSEAIEGFDAMAETIAGHIEEQGATRAQSIQLDKARRSAVFTAAVGVAGLVLAGFLASSTRDSELAARSLEELGVEGEAEIEERFLAPNGVTPRLVYRVTTSDGSTATRNAEVKRAFWNALEGVDTVRVLYVPGDPANSRLLRGEVETGDLLDQPIAVYGLCLLVALMCLFFLASAVLMWRGFDIDFDSKTGRVSIQRFGSGR